MNAESLEVQILSFLQSLRAAMVESSRTKEIDVLFSGAVEFLRTAFPNPSIKRMAVVMNDAVIQKVTPLTPGTVKGMAFLATSENGGHQAMIVAPENWHEMIRQDPITQLGAVVLAGSHAVDYVNERFLIDPENVVTRAVAYEAEYLLTVRSLSPSWELSEYHQKVLGEYPEGLATPKAKRVLYDAKPLILA